MRYRLGILTLMIVCYCLGAAAQASAHHGIPVHLTSGHDTWAVNTNSNLHVYAYCGNDRVVTDAGDDVLEGMCGNDILEGNGGNDRLVGGMGADILVGGPGFDNCIGNSGADQYIGCEVIS